MGLRSRNGSARNERAICDPGAELSGVGRSESLRRAGESLGLQLLRPRFDDQLATGDLLQLLQLHLELRERPWLRDRVS